MPTPALVSVSSGLATPTAYSVPCSTSSSTFDMGQRVYGGFTVSGSGGTSWTLSYINQLGGTVQTTPSTSSPPYCDSVGYLIPSSGSSGAWTLEVQDASKIDVGQATFTVQNVAIPDLPSGIFLLLVPLALVYLVMRRRAVG